MENFGIQLTHTDTIFGSLYKIIALYISKVCVMHATCKGFELNILNWIVTH